MSAIRFLGLIAAMACLCLAQCKKAEPPPAPAAVPAQVVAAALPEPATAAAVPGDATRAVAPAVAPPPSAPSPSASISPFIDAGPGNPTGLPEVGKPTKVGARPVNELGRAIVGYEPVFGAQLALVALRYDLSWSTVMLANDLGPDNKFTHQFNMTFPKAGRHVLYFIFQPKGMPVTMVPLDITVQGAAEPGQEWPESLRTFAGPSGLTVALAVDQDVVAPCQPVHVASSWLRKGRQIVLQGRDDQPRVFYLGVAQNMGRLVIGRPALAAGTAAEQLAAAATGTGNAAISVPTIGGDLGSDALLKFENIGAHKILAVADIGTAKAPQLTVAWFALTVKGDYPEHGCP